MKRLRELLRSVRAHAAAEGHMLYVLDALDLIAEELDHTRHWNVVG